MAEQLTFNNGNYLLSECAMFERSDAANRFIYMVREANVANRVTEVLTFWAGHVAHGSAGELKCKEIN